jgi:DNA polymerase III epsilon subunit family exonuclease
MGTGLDEIDFAVVDVETTGLYPRGHDRVIEIAIVRLMAGGRLSEEFVTLINPGRDLGPTQIHGITTQDILDAPLFADIAGDVLARLHNAVVVAHNVRFDTAFLIAECGRVGVRLPDFPKLCTLKLAGIVGDKFAGRTLAACCEHFGIEVERSHTAAGDARACARLLATCLERADDFGISTLSDLIGKDARFARDWPKLPRSGKALRRSEARRLRKIQPNYLARLVTRLMGTAQNKKLTRDMSAYLGLLDKVLEDRLVSDTEAEALLAFAKEYGLSGEQVVAAHRSYLEDLAQAALADGVVTESEERDLLEVTKLLGFDGQTLASVLDEARRKPVKHTSIESELSGKSVCFTGTLMGRINGERIEREQAHELATDAGLIVAKNVTKNLDILVVADPLTLSRKAQRARDYGTRIIAEMAFWRAIGVSVD